MNHISDSERANITAIIVRVVSELAGGHRDDDAEVASLISQIIEVCYRTKSRMSPSRARSLLFESVDCIDQKDWLLVVKKIGESFQFEAKFGTDIENAKLEATVEWVAKAGIN